MYKILEAGKLAGNIYQMVVEAPRVAKHCLPGQFIIVKARCRRRADSADDLRL